MEATVFWRSSKVWSVLTALCLAVSASAQTNFITDPSFELGTSKANGGWTAYNNAVLNSTPHPRTGTKSIRLPAEGTISAGAYETISNADFTAGVQFDLTAWGFLTNTMTTGYVGIEATFYNVTGTSTQNLGTVESGPGKDIISNHIDSNSVLNTWIELDTGTFTAPTGLPITYMQVFPFNNSAGPIGTSAWIDDFNLVIVPEPSTILLGSIGLIGLIAAMWRRRKA